MDTLSTSVSALKIPGLPTATLREHGFKPLHPTHLHNKPNSISNRPTSSFTNKSFRSHIPSASKTLSSKSASHIVIVRHKSASDHAACGYAAALLDIAQCNNTLEVVERDVRRCLRLLQSENLQAVLVDPIVDDTAKCEVLKDVVEKGRFKKHLVVLLKMLIKKNNVGMVYEVLEEFERVYESLSGTQMVLVSSMKKMEEDQLFGIAKRVQKMSGAMKVKVKHFDNHSLPSFAV